MDQNNHNDVEMRDAQQDLAEEWIYIQSDDGFTYLVKGKIATLSGTLKNNLTSDLVESQTKTCLLSERGLVVEKLLEYLAFKYIWSQPGITAQDMPDFLERIPPEIALELLMAADYYEA